MENKKADLRINIPHMENPDNQPTSNMVKEILEEAKKDGLLDFEMVRFRKCDFCEKRLEETDEFISLPQENGDVLDKCAECVKNGK